MKNTLAWIERGHDRAHGAVVHVSFATVSLSIHFHAHLLPPPAPSLPHPLFLSRAKFIATGEKFLVEFNRLISLSQFDVREKIKTNRKRRQRSVRKRKPANSSLPANVIVGREMQRKRRVYPGRFPTVFLRIKRATYHPRFIWQPRQTPISLPATDFIESFALFVSVLDRSSGLWSRSRGNRGKMVKI